MKTPMLLLPVLLLLLATSDSEAARPNAEQARLGALAEVIREPVYWKENWKKPDTKEFLREMKLDKKHPCVKLPIGACVACGEGGQVKIWLSRQTTIKLTGEKKPHKSAQNKSESGTQEKRWYIIPNIPLDDRDAVGKALDNLARAGRVRSAAVIFWPADKSTVWPDALIFRWKPLPNGQAVTLTLTDLSGKTALWKEDEIDGHAGSLTSDEARAALRRWRDAGNMENVLLQINNGSDPPSSVVFSVMSAESETALKHDLAFWDKEPAGVFRCLGRAAVFDDYHLDSEEANEFEAALRLEPDSALLRTRTANAHRNYGNMVRADELASPQATRIPSHTSVKSPNH